jgi:hypothetical protein
MKLAAVFVQPFGLILFAVAMIVGCGGDSGRGPTGTISGKLTVNGQPAPAKTQVFFLSNTGDATSAEVAADGTFTIMGVTVGSYQVSVKPPPSATENVSPEEAMRMMYGTEPGGKGTNPNAFSSASAVQIPAKYTSFSDSGITFEVKEGVNDFALDLK